MKTKALILLLISAAFAIAAHSQSYQNLWATGSAVPGGTQQLTKRPDGKFSFAGPLNVGELKVMTTAQPQQGVTQYLRPQLVDSYLINYGLSYAVTTDTAQAGWVVSFQEDTYYFIVDTQNRRITGELLLPWNELLIAGSAFEGGSDNVEWKRDNMLPFVRDHEDPYVFTWTGELGDFGGVEPGYLKLEGQMTWGPRELHPFVQGEDILQASLLRRGGDDTKWHVSQRGIYHITVNLLRETIHAELESVTAPLNPPEGGMTDGINDSSPLGGTEGGYESSPLGGTEGGRRPECLSLFFDPLGRTHQRLQHGLNIVRMSDGSVRKIIR